MSGLQTCVRQTQKALPAYRSGGRRNAINQNPRPAPITPAPTRLREDQLDRIGELSVVVSFRAPHVWYWGDRHRDIFLGPERAARIDPLSSALRRGIRFGLHNNSPVTSVSPLLSIGTAVSWLTGSGRLLGAEQAITVDQALRSMTLDSVYLAFEDDLKGTLREGKLGDVVVLEADPYEVSPQEIKDIPIGMTVVGSEVVYGAV
jgi:predicted amidohydrolase YtcJ